MRKLVAVAVVLMAAACSSSAKSASTSSTTTTPATHSFDVRVIAEKQGFGCFYTPVAGGSALIVKDADGKIVDSQTFAITTPGTSCDFTAHVSAVPSSGFYTLEANDGTKLKTVAESDAATGLVVIQLSPNATP